MVPEVINQLLLADDFETLLKSYWKQPIEPLPKVQSVISIGLLVN